VSAAKPDNVVWLDGNWGKYSINISDQVCIVFREVRKLLLLDPEKSLRFLDPNQTNQELLPYFRAWNGDQRLRQHALLRSALPRTFRGSIYGSAGIKPGELGTSGLSIANLSDLRASVIGNGAFKIALTNDPTLHLRFDDNDEMRPTLFILDSRTVLMLALLDLTGFMS
jgi:hypothetical protein